MFKTRIIDDEYAFVVATNDRVENASQSAETIYENLADFIASQGMRITHERVFGSLSTMDEVVRVRNAILAAQGITGDSAFTYVEGKPAWGDGVSGVIVQTVRQQACDGDVETIFDQGEAVGTLWSYHGDRHVILQGLRAGGPASPERQAGEVIERAERILESVGMDFSQVARTWFYLDDILAWYPDFNRVRSGLYDRYGIMPGVDSPDLRLPSSTGIHGRSPNGSAITLDVMAIQRPASSSLTVRQLSNPGQRDAFKYGSAFSRGALIKNGSAGLLEISGTASIDELGRTIHLNDVEKQIHCTFDKLSALLGTVGATLDDITAACVFMKRAEFIDAYRQIKQERGLENFPGVCMVADVCRDDLLFEIDAEGVA